MKAINQVGFLETNKFGIYLPQDLNGLECIHQEREHSYYDDHLSLHHICPQRSRLEVFFLYHDIVLHDYSKLHHTCTENIGHCHFFPLIRNKNNSFVDIWTETRTIDTKPPLGCLQTAWSLRIQKYKNEKKKKLNIELASPDKSNLQPNIIRKLTNYIIPLTQ